MFAIAGDASPENSNRLPYEAGASIAFGLPADEALKSLTIYPAQILGLDDRVGMLKEGMEATLMITDGSPVEYATRVHQTYIRGAKSDMMDNHRKLYERYRKKVDEWQSRKD
jgi:imidazolonepropionase-like amidohydrolase